MICKASMSLFKGEIWEVKNIKEGKITCNNNREDHCSCFAVSYHTYIILEGSMVLTVLLISIQLLLLVLNFNGRRNSWWKELGGEGRSALSGFTGNQEIWILVLDLPLNGFRKYSNILSFNFQFCTTRVGRRCSLISFWSFVGTSFSRELGLGNVYNKVGAENLALKRKTGSWARLR